MSDERCGIETLRKAIDEVAGGLPAHEPRRPGMTRAWVAIAASVAVAGAVALYRRAPRLEEAAPPAVAAAPARFGVEVRLLRVNGRDVGARVFDAARAGTLVVAPEIAAPGTEGRDGARPVGAMVLPRGGKR